MNIKTINIDSKSLTELFVSFHSYIREYNKLGVAVDTLINFLKDNYKTISRTRLEKICANAYHFDKVKDVCSIVALMNRKYVKGFTLRDAFSKKNKTHVILPCVDKKNKRCGYLLINRDSFGQKSKSLKA